MAGNQYCLIYSFVTILRRQDPTTHSIACASNGALPLSEQSPPYRAAAPLPGSSCNDNTETSISIAG